MSFTFPAMPVNVRTGASRISLEAFRRNCDRCHGMVDTPDKPEGQEAAEVVDLDALLEENLPWGHAGNVGNVNEEAGNATVSLVTNWGGSVPVLNMGFLKLMRAHADKV